MSLRIHLLGRPRIEARPGDFHRFRSRKSWALLAYLIMAERAPTRSQLASLLFAEADDPLAALRWSLSEIRRGLGDEGTVVGDSVSLQFAPGVMVDVQVVIRGSWSEAVALPGLGADLLEGTTPRAAAGFDTWLLAQQRHVAAASEAILHKAALESMSRGAVQTAIGYAVRAARSALSTRIIRLS
jgi:DNA-binding SARP family transcriptional activator